MNQSIDVAVPTYESEPVLDDALECLGQSERAGPVDISCLHIIDNESDDRTLEIGAEYATKYGWDTDFISRKCSLPVARQLAIERIESEWFLFLDDDVQVTESYLESHINAIAPRIGAVQGRKSGETAIGHSPSRRRILRDSTELQPSEWVRRRAFRGGTHATLIRREAASTVAFPRDLLLWEDEFLRREIESNGYLWVFNHQARFTHRTQNPRSQGWHEGYLQGKYDLRPAWHVCLAIPYATLSDSSTIAAVKLAAGYAKGRFDTGKMRS